MKWNHIKGLQPDAFRRLTGVKQATFEKMVEILRKAQVNKKAQGGRPNTLSIEAMLLMCVIHRHRFNFLMAKSI